LTPEQLEDLRTYYEIEPWGGPVEDYRAALVTWGSVMPHTGKRRVTPDQFVPKWGPSDPVTPESYAAKARAVYAGIAAKSRGTHG
jgi:hypothetical protein